MFIATGQDVANVAESSAAIMYSELTDEGDLYVSITIPSLIVATYGSGTGMGTQRECLELIDCYGKNKVYKFAEIVASVALAGEISLASAISSSDWVSSHEQYGRNRWRGQYEVWGTQTQARRKSIPGGSSPASLPGRACLLCAPHF